MDFTDRHVVITGATGALGGSVVAALLARGATCHLPMVEAAVPGHVAWKDHPRALARAGMSLDHEAQVTAYYAELPALWASIHLVGGFHAAPIVDTALATVEAQWRLNTVTAFLGCREAVRAIRRSQPAAATGGGGRIVNVGARPVVAPVGGMLAYTTAKAAVAALTQGLAAEVVAEGILVNAVLPSIIDSPANRAAMPTADHAAWPKPAELAEAIAFLASPANTLTSGALVPVYGKA